MEGDADLVARVRSGDRDSFDELYDTYADDVFSMCLLILGDPAVARAAAGTAFALVARTRLNPLTDPNRLRSWLLELARGSALAWSGSPQARSVPVPHGVSAEEMIEGAVVPAPASLRVGLARTFDRAAIAAADRQPAHLGLRKVSNPDADVHDAPTEIGRGERIGRRIEQQPALVDVGDGQPYDDSRDSPTVVPLPRHVAASGGSTAAPAEWRTRPAITVAAALVLAVAGVTAAVSWPTSSNSISAEEFPEVAVVSASPASGTSSDAPGPPRVAVVVPPPAVVPTVAGMFTRVPADERPGNTPAQPTVPSTTTRDHVAPPPPPPPPPTTNMPPPVTRTPGTPTTDPVPPPTSEEPTEPAPDPTTDAPAPSPEDPTKDPDVDPTVVSPPADPTITTLEPVPAPPVPVSGPIVGPIVINI